MIKIYVSSVDYGGYNYEQSDAGVDLMIVDDDAPPIEETITATLSTSSLTLEEGRAATITRLI